MKTMEEQIECVKQEAKKKRNRIDCDDQEEEQTDRIEAQIECVGQEEEKKTRNRTDCDEQEEKKTT